MASASSTAVGVVIVGRRVEGDTPVLEALVDDDEDDTPVFAALADVESSVGDEDFGNQVAALRRIRVSIVMR